jgi:hypothetical protein
MRSGGAVGPTGPSDGPHRIPTSPWLWWVPRRNPTDEHFSHTWLDRGGAEADLMELNGWSSPQMLRRYGASAGSARARRSYDRIMDMS